LEKTLSDAMDAGCGRLDVFFMIGLPKQSKQSVMENVEYCDYLLQKFRGDRRLCLFIAPVSPFLDPGSLGFEQPERYGYHILFHSLEEYRQALIAPSWKYGLNYETEWMTRQQIVDTTYEALIRLNRIKAKYENIPKKMAKAGELRLNVARDMLHRIDDILSRGNHQELSLLKPEMDRINMLPVSEKIQLELPIRLIKLKPWRYLWSLVNRRR
jgi:hypothetical protein